MSSESQKGIAAHLLQAYRASCVRVGDTRAEGGDQIIVALRIYSLRILSVQNLLQFCHGIVVHILAVICGGGLKAFREDIRHMNNRHRIYLSLKGFDRRHSAMANYTPF